jgi:hypothetical protein
MGHASLQVTVDLYSHLWTDDEAERSAAAATEHALFGGNVS